MTVYIEYALIDNAAFDLLLLLGVKYTLRLNVRPLRFILCLCLCVAFAVVVPLLSLPQLALAAVKLAFVPLMCLVFVNRGQKSKYIWSILLFYAYTFVLGGACFALLYWVCGFTIADGVIAYSYKLPLGLLVFAALLFTYLTYSIVHYLRHAKRVQAYEKTVTLRLGGITAHLAGYVDSGNLLTFNGLPVCFLTDAHLRRRIGRYLSGLIARGESKLVKISYCTVDGSCHVNACPCTITVDATQYPCYLALSRQKSRYSVLLNASVTGGKNETVGISETNPTA